ncbi:MULTISPECIES: PBPRA1643 family SWIM/SEC-C metal-binding motif protein [unclassified Shewanella]|uniref:PBPRA1643 family SWIM/SEC-C metal-binding motif protein n=1 Tax=unclassified Shewanella TaxID=196818 RepID=UPI000C84A395|nr:MULTISPECIES: PBPRA1643 family SWIM/SEC-C metal-binding motif protein [unclassified Shewanella]MDO6619215.1 SEC-C metal-binding domain-containing protein [Shewanella sp. 6_MG-2023]MDO6638859.1 SEC-C metal-binding domain-containing protein [Shewanella sp. 5_MG-2023]MDO6677215.1 SEC-C metal-binding domain-containing protein [Shewanella sp. 4_MG-2023]MDO6773877.1 SEC-C metal-binding domain-containing protein [Shewanella sp. 3_MG-2023]PMG31576.1 zinc chelation protein SecC [Shewanella sp. 10N.2
MSDKFFFKGRQTPKPAYGESGYNTKRQAKPGTAALPLQLSVQTDKRKLEVEALVAESKLVATITVNSDVAEDIFELLGILNKPTAVTAEAKINRNDPCTCGSGKKYKKCCG